MQPFLIPLGALAGAVLPRWLGGARDRTTESPPPDSASAAANQNRSLADALAGQNVRQMSLRQFGALVERLHDVRQLSDADYDELNEFRRTIEQRAVESEKPLDLLRLAREEQAIATRAAQAAALEGGSPDALEQLATRNRQVAWLERFARMSAGPFDGPLDAVA